MPIRTVLIILTLSVTVRNSALPSHRSYRIIVLRRQKIRLPTEARYPSLVRPFKGPVATTQVPLEKRTLLLKSKSLYEKDLDRAWLLF